MEQQGKVCSKCGMWKPLEEYCRDKSKKNGRRSECKECEKQYREANKERRKEYDKQWREGNKEYRKEYRKQWKENNPEYSKQHYQNNKECYKEQSKQWREDNKEYRKEYEKQYREKNKDKIREYEKKREENNKNKNIKRIEQLLIMVNPIFAKLNLSIYGYVYKIANIKTNKVYIGQTIYPLNRRYHGNVIKGWIKERKRKTKQKFLEELIEEDFVVTELFDVAFCQYHLNMLEAYYIEKYDSYNNGYNNQPGNHNSNDGIKEFNQILVENNLEFIGNELRKIND